ncbi:WecB/TagA/CpsF family glycosyltransferase [Bacillus sp. NEB1478]|uniref:WecB/TagA/CpsF family glycosyltransferase n=1 Tax=Bacillus sp. NEB1478 TaxID=3073816 RepID=UPI0028737141|nr:WecB/TagA/CpsF family glycosyltransferase [Bacillus sp. NEB1478]WNB92502.1 WecB/TagA/CpsF family glycosyltransferase [Bacillus sp. NEB1478]
METTKIFNINFNRITLKELIEEINNKVKNNKRIHIHTANVDHVVLANKNLKFKKVIEDADIVVADGMPIVWSSKLIKNSIPERVTGVDLSYEICGKSNEYDFKIFLLGAAEGIAEKAKRNLLSKFPDLKIVDLYSPSPEELLSIERNDEILMRINSSGANILLVSLGTPKQEYWINENKEKLITNVNIGVGATIDFMAGEIDRAPLLLRNIGLEWFYRLLREPKRLFKRYIVNDSYFLIIILKEIWHYISKRKEYMN